MNLPVLKLRDIVDEGEEIGPDTFADKKVVAEITRRAAALTDGDVCDVGDEWVVCFDDESGGRKTTSGCGWRWKKRWSFVGIWVWEDWSHLGNFEAVDDVVFDSFMERTLERSVSF